MPKYPWKNYSPLRTHDFDEGVAHNGVQPGVLFVCRNCLRRFKFDPGAHTTWAVGAPSDDFLALRDSVTRRWVSEWCSGGPATGDAEDSKQIKLAVHSRRKQHAS